MVADLPTVALVKVTLWWWCSRRSSLGGTLPLLPPRSASPILCRPGLCRSLEANKSPRLILDVTLKPLPRQPRKLTKSAAYCCIHTVQISCRFLLALLIWFLASFSIYCWPLYKRVKLKETEQRRITFDVVTAVWNYTRFVCRHHQSLCFLFRKVKVNPTSSVQNGAENERCHFCVER